jgi:hypothetical protein
VADQVVALSSEGLVWGHMNGDVQITSLPSAISGVTLSTQQQL